MSEIPSFETSRLMRGVTLPGNRQVRIADFPVPTPGPGQALIKMKASSICGSDIRAIYREHLGHGPEGYNDVIAGHEPSGQIVALGPGAHRFKVGDRVIVYHISGCGVCDDCRQGYMISCASHLRAAYGWQRDGGHADYLLAEENTLVPLPEPLSYVDGALIACGFGTAYEALLRVGLSGNDSLLITGLGPVGLAVAMLARALGAPKIIGSDPSVGRRALAEKLDLVDLAIPADESAKATIRGSTAGYGPEVAIDCSGSPQGRLLALESTRRWGRIAFVGEGNTVSFDVSQTLIHSQKTVFGSWVTSLHNMESLAERLVRWEIHPEKIVTHRFLLYDVAQAYRVADEGESGKVCVVFD